MTKYGLAKSNLKPLPESVYTSGNYTEEEELQNPEELEKQYSSEISTYGESFIDYKELYAKAYKKYQSVLADYLLFVDDKQFTEDNSVFPNLDRIEEKQNVISNAVLKIANFLENEWNKPKPYCSQR